jgi:hypothetical protein
MISLSALTILVTVSLIFASSTPLILVAMMYTDIKNGKLW